MQSSSGAELVRDGRWKVKGAGLGSTQVDGIAELPCRCEAVLNKAKMPA